MKLTANFSLEELTASRIAAVNGWDNSCPPELMANLRRTARFLEQIRALLDVPIIINSGYRNPFVNGKVGGSASSAHCKALAVDFIAPKYGNPYKICKAIAAAKLPYDQLIHEYGSWVHVGLAEDGKEPRQQALSIFKPGEYLPGIRLSA